MPTHDLRAVESHFGFGENWEAFNRNIRPAQFQAARAGLQKLLPESLEGKSFLDIGSGSGLSSWAALHLGAGFVDAIDIDLHSVSATKSLLEASSFSNWSVRQQSVFDLQPDRLYDFVHSWGVLHHTGDVWEALSRAGAVVAPAGYFIVALYRRTPLCAFWHWEKRWYSQRASAFSRKLARAAYMVGISGAMLAAGRNPWRYQRSYSERRGMSWIHDVHDWLGGYPYESVTAADVMHHMSRIGFAPVRTPAVPTNLAARLGLVVGCDEFVFKRVSVC
jgi:SAM-dependent methyltransferase